MNYYETKFTDGSHIECLGTCESDAGSRALRIRDQQRGDNLAVIESIRFTFNR